MPPSVISLRDWHTRLEKHFRNLCVARKPLFGPAVYALEHGLIPQEREQLLEAVRAAVVAGSPSNVFWLPYVVYAAEIGYEFAGEEYWQTFEDRTPGWDANADRPWLREQFQKFARMFGGAVPQGAWAKHFSIICWPIAHAILPRDLQQQLAATLHDLRWSLRVEHLTDPLVLGTAISTRSRFQNSRFTAFAEDAALIGQIASALLLNDTAQTLHLIHPPTLERIAGDLDKQRVAREWLYEARQQAARVTLRGVLPAGRPEQERPADLELPVPAATGRRFAAGPQRQPSLGIDPRVVLRPAEPAGWTVHLEIPDLQHLLDSPEWTEVLTRSRCRVAGGGKRPLAPGRLLHGVQRIHLERWPGADEVLLGFDGATPPVQAALKTTALLSPGPWLFKLAADGRAYHIRGRVFRPGAEYLLVSDKPIEYDRSLLPAELQCTGVHAACISVPSFVPANLEGVLRDYGISRASSIRIAPAGVPPLFWDGEGRAEWLTTDTAVLSVERETDSEEIELVLEGSPAVQIPVGSDGPVFVELPSMQAGVHAVRVHARSADGRIASARVDITIRPPRPWKGELGEQHAVQVTVAPAQATMEDLLSGRFRLEVRGPDGLRVESDVRLWDYRRQKQLYRKSLTSVRLPFDLGTWRRAFVNEFLDAQPVQQELDRGWAIEVDLSFGAVASQRLLFTRHLAPLRWSVRSGKRGYDLFLTDDTGAEGVASVQFRSFRDPATPMQLVPPAPGVGLVIPDGGGLVEAVHGGERALAVVAPPGLRDLGALRVEPVVPSFRRAPDGMSALLQLASLWAAATPQGSQLARLRQCEVLRALHRSLVDALCGSRWRIAERKFLDDGLSMHDFAREVSSSPADAEFRKALKFTPRRFSGMSPEDRADSLAGTISMLRDRKVRAVEDVALALDLMSVPERLPRLAEGRWAGLLGDATMMRAARFVVIAMHKEAEAHEITALPLYAGWN